MVGKIFCPWTFTRLHCGNRSRSNCSLFCGSYFGSQKRIHYAVIGILCFCLFHALSTVMHSVLSAASSDCSSLPLAFRSSSPTAFQNQETSRLVNSCLKSHEMARWINFPQLREKRTLFSHLGWSASQQIFIKHPRSAQQCVWPPFGDCKLRQTSTMANRPHFSLGFPPPKTVASWA